MRRVRRGGFIGVGALAAAAVLAGCGAAVPPYLGSSSSSSTTIAPVPSGNEAAGTNTSSGSGSTSGSGSSSASSASSGSQAGSPSSSSSSASHGSNAASGPSPAPPGTYHYNQTGNVNIAGSAQNVPAQGTIVIDPATAHGQGTWIQVWHSAVDPSQQPSDTTFVIAPSGISIVSETIRMSGAGQTITYACTFVSPMEIVAWPTAVGHSFTGTANCAQPSGSGSFTVHATGSISGTQATNDGGAPTTAYVVTTHVTTSGQVTSTDTENDWFDPALGIDLHQDMSESGNYGGFANFSTQVTRDLVSSKPS